MASNVSLHILVFCLVNTRNQSNICIAPVSADTDMASIDNMSNTWFQTDTPITAMLADY